MKIAVQLFGHLRTYKKCFPALKKHLLSKYDCDIFIHSFSPVCYLEILVTVSMT
jgi:hypothetical protein